jgi:hypothetical protein
MDRDDFIIHVYCQVCEHYQAIKKQLSQPLRKAGFEPQLSDEEVIAIEICGEMFKMPQDKDLFTYFISHYRHFFPGLRERTAFVRQAAALWRIKILMQKRIVRLHQADADPVQAIDTMPLPVCSYTRSKRDRCFVGEADYGFCAAKEERYYGFKLGLRISRCGFITHYPLLAARPHDVKHLPTLVEAFQGIAPADKGFIDSFGHALLQTQGVFVIAPPRKNSKTPSPHPPALLKACARWRKKVETVASHLTERFAVARIRVHDLWHFQHRLIRKVLAHTMAVALNIQLKREPLDLDGLVCLNSTQVAH